MLHHRWIRACRGWNRYVKFSTDSMQSGLHEYEVRSRPCLAAVVLGRVHDSEMHDVSVLACQGRESSGDSSMLYTQSAAHIFTDENFVSCL